jgi:hypothetical protein
MQQASVGLGRSDQENRAIESRVAQLEGDPPVNRLNVPEPCFGIDANSQTGSRERGIPGSEIALDWDHDFRPPRERGRNAFSEPCQQRELGGVAEAAACGIGPRRKLKAEDAEDLGDHDERNVWMTAAFDEPVLARDTPIAPPTSVWLRFPESLASRASASSDVSSRSPRRCPRSRARSLVLVRTSSRGPLIARLPAD